MFPARTSPSGEGTNTTVPASNRPPAYTKFAPHPLRYPQPFHSIPPLPPIMHPVGMMATPHINPVFVHSNQNPNPYYFDAARFVCDKKVTDKQHMSKPRYLDIERERQVTRWLMEANDALTQQEKNHKYRSPTKKKPFLRRFHSHDSTRQSEHWSDNFILMDNVHPKKTAALLRRFQSQTRDASPCERPTEPNPNDRTGSLDSKEAGTSKNASPLSTNERSSENNSSKTGSGVSGSRTYMLKDFVEKYSLPRVVKLDDDERPVLLYRCFESHTKVEAVQVSGKKGKAVGKPIYIPEGYGGWFSVCTCRGGVLARPRNTVAQLVRARAPGLVCARALSAYRARQENDPSRPAGGGGGQYERAAVRAGGALRLAAVFADGGKAKAPRYAQLLDSHANELFVPLNTKGEFYEVCMEEISKIPFAEHLEATGDSIPEQLSPEDKERVHQLSHLLSVCRLPVRVKLIAGPVPIEMAQDIGDDILLTAVITEPVLVMCTLPEYGSSPSSPTKPTPDRTNTREALKFISLNSNIKVRRTQLGYETEKRMFLSTRLQKALSFCQMNVDNWIRHISYVSTENSALSGSVHTRVKTAEELLKERGQEQLQAQAVKFEKERKFTLQGLKIDTSRLFGKSDKVLKDIPDENEGSIIFLSKNELEHMNYEVYSDEEVKEETKPNEIKKEEDDEVEKKQFAGDKMQVFREDSEHPKRNKWFKHLKLLKSTEKLTDEKITALEKSQKAKEIRDPFDPFAEKHSSIERYQDMAKLIEDRFGATRKTDAISEKCHSYKSSTTTSDLGNIQSPANTKKHILTKSVSVQTGMTDTLLMQKEPATNLKQIRKNLSVDQINYCGSMESNSSNRKLNSLDENMLTKTSASKSASNLEKRQRIQPDLIPDNKGIIKSESYNQIQSCEEINMFGLGSMYNDSDFEINYKQHSYITEKLCSEFHVKTKRVLSKSTSNLLHAKKLTEAKKEGTNSMPTKSDMHAHPDSAEKVNFGRRQEKMRDSTPSLEIEVELHHEDDSKNQAKLRRSISSIQKRKLPVIEDLPYGQVADAVGENEEKIDSDTNSDNIYAEICNPTTVIMNDNENEQYDFNTDILANDPIISNVKKEVISRNDERIKQMANDIHSENPFRHIEVVVIENNSEFTSLGNHSASSSEYGDEDFEGSKNDLSQDSWERDKCIDRSVDSKMHAIRLEITSNADEFPDFGKDDSTDRRNVRLSKEANLSFVHDIHLSGTYLNVSTSEAIYNTLK